MYRPNLTDNSFWKGTTNFVYGWKAVLEVMRPGRCLKNHPARLGVY